MSDLKDRMWDQALDAQLAAQRRRNPVPWTLIIFSVIGAILLAPWLIRMF